MIRVIDLDINEMVYQCEVDFDYTPAVRARLYGPPENCSEGEPEEWTINSLTYTYQGEEHSLDIIIPAFKDDLVCLLEELLEDEREYYEEPDDFE